MADNFILRKRAAVLCLDAPPTLPVTPAMEKARRKLLAKRHKTLSKSIIKHQGRVVRVRGDEILAVFVEAQQAVGCAIDFQKHAIARNKNVAPEKQVHFRAGVGLGQIAVDKETIEGDAVTLATDLCAAMLPDGVWVSSEVPNDLQGRMPVVLTEVDAPLAPPPLTSPTSTSHGPAFAVDLSKQPSMRAADFLLPNGRGGWLTLIAPMSAMLILVVIAYFWFAS